MDGVKTAGRWPALTKKGFAVFLVVLISATMFAAVAGCSNGKSGDAAQAKKLMTQGDDYVAEYESKDPGFGPGGGMQPPDVTNGENTQDDNAGEPPDETQMEERMKEMETQTEEMKEILSKARASYEDILKLSGADDYKEYANKMLELVSAYEEELDGKEEMAGNMPDGSSPRENPPDISNGPPGTLPSGPQGSLPSELQDRDQTMGPGGNQEIEQLKNEAEQIKAEKNL
ncbi:MAG: hypothetical protein JXA49_09020 [Actinobacteria bacterium]|nr:hypothetical protein [Actinomycetota bacterium]